jgi:hypothetical protein
MKRIITLIFLVALTVPTLTGCYHNQIIVSDNYNASATEPDWRSGFQMYLLAGLIPLGENPVMLDQACPQGAGLIEVKQSFVNGLLNSLVGTIISFQDVSVYCAKAAAENEAVSEPVASK